MNNPLHGPFPHQTIPYFRAKAREAGYRYGGVADGFHILMNNHGTFLIPTTQELVPSPEETTPRSTS